MAWQNRDRILKRQMFNFTGGGSQNLSTTFSGAGITNVGVFNLNNGIVLSNKSCDFQTNWAISGSNVNLTSRIETWSDTPTRWHADVEDQRTMPIYISGTHTTRTIPSGYCLYTLEINGRGTMTFYENDVPFTVTAASTTVMTPMKVYRTYYNQTASNLQIRANSTNLSYAYISSGYYYTKTSRNVTNTCFVMEDLYGTGMSGGVTLPPAGSGGGSGGSGGGSIPTPELAPVLGSVGWESIIIDFARFVDESNAIPNISAANYRDFTPILPQGIGTNLTSGSSVTHVTIPRMTSPMIVDGRAALLVGTNVTYLQIGMKGYPVDRPVRCIRSGNTSHLRIVQYSTGAVDRGTTHQNLAGTQQFTATIQYVAP